jgi:hypothetical protein
MCDATVKDVETLEFISIYQRLADRQEPLGKEFDKCLYENLWDLMIETQAIYEAKK